MLPSDPLEYIDTGRGSGVGGGFASAVAQPVAPPDRIFDTSPLAGLRQTDKYRGNLVQDINEALESYRLNTSVGRGGRYAQDVVNKYGAADVRAGAASYLQAAGLSFLAEAVQPTPTPTPDPVPNPPPTPTPNPVKTPVEVLSDVISKLFGNAVYNPPLQSQATGYTPVSVPSSGGDSGASGGGIGLLLLLGAAAIAAYFIYKRYSG